MGLRDFIWFSSNYLLDGKIWGAILLITVILVAIELFVEIIGLAGKNYQTAY